MSNIFSGNIPHGQTREHDDNDSKPVLVKQREERPTTGDLASHHERLEELNQELQGVAQATSMDDLDQASEWAREAMRNTSEAIDALVESQTPEGVDASDAIKTYNKLAANLGIVGPRDEPTWKGFYEWLDQDEDAIKTWISPDPGKDE